MFFRCKRISFNSIVYDSIPAHPCFGLGVAGVWVKKEIWSLNDDHKKGCLLDTLSKFTYMKTSVLSEHISQAITGAILDVSIHDITRCQTEMDGA